VLCNFARLWAVLLVVGSFYGRIFRHVCLKEREKVVQIVVGTSPSDDQ
jgi:hypothetical protein